MTNMQSTSSTSRLSPLSLSPTPHTSPPREGWNQRQNRRLHKRKRRRHRAKTQQRILIVCACVLVGMVSVVVHVELSLLTQAADSAKRGAGMTGSIRDSGITTTTTKQQQQQRKLHQQDKKREQHESHFRSHGRTLPTSSKSQRSDKLEGGAKIYRTEDNEFDSPHQADILTREDNYLKDTDKMNQQSQQQQHISKSKAPQPNTNIVATEVEAEKQEKIEYQSKLVQLQQEQLQDQQQINQNEQKQRQHHHQQQQKNVTAGNERPTSEAPREPVAAPLPQVVVHVHPVVKTEDHPEVSKVVAKALKEAHSLSLPKTANFCGGQPSSPAGDSGSSPVVVAPAVIILGMEDTSTDLLWHVLSEITPAGSVSEPVGHQPLAPVKYEWLNQMDPDVEDNFWEKISANNNHWIGDVICNQQVDHEQKLMGFPWLTLGDMVTKNTKATNSLSTLSKYPKNTVKVIRYRRNLLDMVARQAQQMLENRQGAGGQNRQPLTAVKLDHKNLLRQLTHWNKQQSALDKFLLDKEIPYIAVDHEALFPFNDWKDLVNVTSMVAEFPVPLNVKMDFSRVPPDQRPPDQSPIEQAWAKLLEFLQFTEPTALHDIFQAAHTYQRRYSVFWTQQHFITNYAAVQKKLIGTHFQTMLRNLEYKHDFYGCACNDKEANKRRLWQGWKDHKMISPPPEPP